MHVFITRISVVEVFKMGKQSPLYTSTFVQGGVSHNSVNDGNKEDRGKNTLLPHSRWDRECLCQCIVKNDWLHSKWSYTSRKTLSVRWSYVGFHSFLVSFIGCIGEHCQRSSWSQWSLCTGRCSIPDIASWCCARQMSARQILFYYGTLYAPLSACQSPHQCVKYNPAEDNSWNQRKPLSLSNFHNQL